MLCVSSDDEGPACPSAAGWCPHLHPPHPPIPPHIPAAKCHIHISCQLINLTALREQGAILLPVWLQRCIFAPRHAFAPKLSDTPPTWATLIVFKVQEGTNVTTLLTQLLFPCAQQWARMLHGHNSWAESWTWWMPWVWGGWYQGVGDYLRLTRSDHPYCWLVITQCPHSQLGCQLECQSLEILVFSPLHWH